MSYQFTYFIMYSLYADEESKSRKKKEHKVDFFSSRVHFCTDIFVLSSCASSFVSLLLAVFIYTVSKCTLSRHTLSSI